MKTRAGGGIRGPELVDRDATLWHVFVKRSANKQWLIELQRSGEVVAVGETRKGKAATVKTAKNIVNDANRGGLFVFDGVLL